MSNNDLISREALKKAFEDTVCIEPMPYTFVKQIIDNAPTVDAYTFKQVKELFDLNVQMADEIENLKRPKGEWIISQTYDCHSDIVNVYTCPFCGKREYSAYPFCHCGADMRKDGAVNEC